MHDKFESQDATVIDITESSCKSCKDQGEKTEHLKRKPTEGIAIRDFWIRQRMTLGKFIMEFCLKKRAAKLSDLSIVCNSVTLGSKINHIEYCTMLRGGCWWWRL
jgi:hypothetical protein